MEDVISILGEPDVTTARYMSYIGKVYNGGWWFMTYHGDFIYGKVLMNFYFNFDNYGVLTDWTTHKFNKAGYRTD